MGYSLTTNLPSSHPAHYLAPLLTDPGNRFTLSRYQYQPDTLADTREQVSFAGGPDALARLAALLDSLPAGFELALSSQVEVANQVWHLPLIDFALPAWTHEASERLARYLPPEVAATFALYASGRSFHGYALYLLTQEEWQRMMACLLLVNPPAGPAIVDTRWIGHRLLAGYGALRWSCQTAQYLQHPKLDKLLT